MKIIVEKKFFNETIFGKFFPQRKSEENLILLKTFQSFSKNELVNAFKQMSIIGYKPVTPLLRKWFKYSFSCGRIVPYYQRLILSEAWVEKPGWQEKLLKANANRKQVEVKTILGGYKEWEDNGLRWEDRYEKVKTSADDIIYTDTDLGIMAKFRDRWNPNGWPNVNGLEDKGKKKNNWE